MNAKESSKVGNQRLQRAVKKKIVEEKENKVKLPQIDVKKRGKRGNSKKTSKEESCQDDVNITIEELVPPLVSIFIQVMDLSNFIHILTSIWRIFLQKKNSLTL